MTEIDKDMAQSVADKVAKENGFDKADFAKDIDGNLAFLLVDNMLKGTICGYPRGILVNKDYKWRVATEEETMKMLAN